MADVKARTAEVVIRTVKLTRALLKQLREVKQLPEEWTERDDQGQFTGFRPEFAVGWFDGSVLGDEYTKFVLLKNGKGDLYLWGRGCHTDPITKKLKQLYI
jgi:hypothetical protein